MTWILPKQLHTLACALDTAALSLDSNESSRICAQSLFVRSKPMPLRTWSAKWKRDSWTRHLSGRILEPSLGERFVTEWTYLLAVTRANHSAQPGSAEAKKIRGISGRGSQMEFDFSGHDAASLKTSKDISRWGCPTSSKTWQEWVTERRGAYSQRLKSARLISGSGCSSWPTSSARDWKGCYTTLQRKDGKMRGDLLPDAVNIEEMHGPPVPASSSTDGSRQELSVATRDGNWTTPAATDTGRTTQYQQGGKALSMQAAAVQWATPIMGDSHLASTPEAAQKRIEEGKVTLSRQMAAWATPRTEHDSGAHRGQPYTLHSQIKSWATPNCPSPHDSNNTAGSLHVTKKQVDLVRNLQLETGSKSGKLNPRWVETLMGLPVGWTMPSCVSPVTIEPMSFDCSATELCQPQPSGPSVC